MVSPAKTMFSMSLHTCHLGYEHHDIHLYFDFGRPSLGYEYRLWWSFLTGTGLDHYGSLITLVSAAHGAHGAHVTYCCLVFIIPKGWTSLTELQTLAKDHRMEFQCLMYPPHAWNRLPPCCSYRIRQDSKESYRSSGFLWVPIPMGSYGFLWVPMGCWGHLHTCLQHHPLALRSGPENVARIDDQDMLQTVLQLP